MSESPAERFGLTIAVTKRIYATHARYAGDELMQQIDEGRASGGGGGGASAHILVDWDSPPERMWGLGIIMHFLIPIEKMIRMFSRGRSTKNYTASETQAYNSKTRGLVRSVKISPPTPTPYGTQ